jgi:hypothetical protein
LLISTASLGNGQQAEDAAFPRLQLLQWPEDLNCTTSPQSIVIRPEKMGAIVSCVRALVQANNSAEVTGSQALGGGAQNKVRL